MDLSKLYTLTFLAFASSQAIAATPTLFDFSDRALSSGVALTEGAVYRYTNIVNVDGVSVDAVLTLGAIIDNGEAFTDWSPAADGIPRYSSIGGDFQIRGSYQLDPMATATLSFVVSGIDTAYTFSSLTWGVTDIESQGVLGDGVGRNSTEIFNTDLSLAEYYVLGDNLQVSGDDVYVKAQGDGAHVQGNVGTGGATQATGSYDALNYTTSYQVAGSFGDENSISLAYTNVSELTFSWGVVEGDDQYTPSDNKGDGSGKVSNRGMSFTMTTDPIPEPSALALVAMGAMGLLLRRGR
ncbi:PEP-CTERM sorting domain-containing protein [Persicirhabdus sediminis]|uniref:PEP-CTERM sorting domain-containing protein n=1 Tax=Persicirhabdus sediminis TaxID=454144 RepID=A0A8J7MES7_9BACT|nr:PEP-CTERM sorting domain-containing protein [Persicirhabdus sediminis]MBK1791392.1 PEP-CTERM sorting domain-containing protein [Persicirhabdus sediminis]